MNANSAQTNPTEQEDSASARLRATQNLLREALKEFRPGSIALSFSGAEDVVLIDLVRKLGRTIDVFSLDTGRLHSETYEFFETIRKQYDQPIELLNPDPEVQNLVKAKGLFSFYEDGHQECCGVRKVQPLRKKLATLDAWITGQRQDQSVTRSNVPLRQYDEAFSTDENDLTKFNPRTVDLSRHLALHPRKPSALQSITRPRLYFRRLPTLHPRSQPIRTRAGWALVVGRSNAEGMRPAWTEHHSHYAGLIRSAYVLS